MTVTLKPVEEQVIVVTGASSGIGLAAALAAAERGARVVLTARDGQALAEVERRIRRCGGEAIHIAADVSDQTELRRVADAAADQYGGFDTWVNNAGTSIFGRLDEVSDADHRRLFDINFWGLVNGSLIAVERLRSRGGALVNMGSLASDIALPLQGMYCASKHAVKGFTDALRMELEEEGAPISVTLIKPTSIDTPFPHRARNYMEHEPKLPSPVYAPQEVARAILHAAAHPRRDIYVGGASKFMSMLGRAAPRVMDVLGENVLMRQEIRDEGAANREGTLYAPRHDGMVRGDHPGHVMETSLYTRASLHPVLTGAVVATAGLAAAACLGRGWKAAGR